MSTMLLSGNPVAAWKTGTSRNPLCQLCHENQTSSRSGVGRIFDLEFSSMLAHRYRGSWTLEFPGSRLLSCGLRIGTIRFAQPEAWDNISIIRPAPFAEAADEFPKLHCHIHDGGARKHVAPVGCEC